ncbi:autotransporter outer membrane beta-barrel domain-containing protein [Achromobacter xylosoxidans]|uniref:autotransporter family protein n=1 Tax=Alcaligenes xylosoxydans xylosoxydans TaxID=85698 RepID=UPI0022B85ABE|nr:autotransporter outer membrane beta-barrel domain-containing protein [Achromobacter xylosoxidans]MCZ8393582.1 autotransporter domain-containing protein [Achromobacter xylosoxidans]
MPPVSHRSGQDRGRLPLALPRGGIHGAGRPNAVAYAVCIALLAGLASAAPGDALAAAGYGGGGAGGAGLGAGGGGGQGGGLTGGIGGVGGNALATGGLSSGGGNGGGDWTTWGGLGGLAGMDGGVSADGAAGGGHGTAYGGAMGAGGGGGGLIGAGGGGGGAASIQSFDGDGGHGGIRGYTITLPGSIDVPGSVGQLGASSLFGAGGGGGGAGVTVLAPGVDLTVSTLTTITGGQGGVTQGVPPITAILLVSGGGGGGAGLVMPSGTLTVAGQVNGGAGGQSPYISGSGGDAVVITSGSVMVKAQGQIVGGRGGRSSSFNAAHPGKTGDGGTGLSIGSGSVINQGSIAGGAPGDRGGISAKPIGAEGAALRAGNTTTVINKGTLTSGSDAVVFEGNGNTLTLWQGSTTTGDVRFEGARNKLALGSDVGSPSADAYMTGSLRLGTDGVYTVRATPTQADQLTVTGSATLTGATVQVLATPGAYAESTVYNILHAGGTFNGTRFAGVTSDLAYLAPTLSYSANDQDVNLTLTRKQVQPGGDPSLPGPDSGGNPPARPIRFADLVSGRNAVAAANAVDGMPTGNELYGHALTLPSGAPQSFFSALSGASHANAIAALQGLGAQARSVPFSRLRANLGAGMRAGSPTAAVGASDAAPPSSALPAGGAQPAWAELVGNWQRLGATGDTSEVRMHTGGIFAGADGAIGRGWRLGGALGYTDSNLRTDGVDGKTDISSYSAVVYGGKAFDAGAGKLNLLLGGAYTWHDIHSKRRVAAGGLDQTLRANYGASTAQVFTELGWTLKAGDTLTLEPYAGLAWANLRNRAFQESGGSAALSGASQGNRTTTSTLGLRGSQTLMLGSFQGTLTAGAGWRHAFGDVNPTSRLAFDAGNAFTVAGAPIARNAAVLEAGLDAKVGRSASVGLSYAGQFGSGNQDHSATLEWRWAF